MTSNYWAFHTWLEFNGWKLHGRLPMYVKDENCLKVAPKGTKLILAGEYWKNPVFQAKGLAQLRKDYTIVDINALT